jgi:sugar lactone lactonase YvrE
MELIMSSLQSTRILRIVAAGAAAFALSAAAAPTIAKAGSPAIDIGGFASPESVVAAGGRRFVSNMGAEIKPTDKDGDGFISEIDDTGRVVELHAFPKGDDAKLNAPKGLAIVAGRLYVADIDRIVGFDLKTHARVFEAALTGEGPALLNDIAVETDRHLIITDTLHNAVYRLDLGSRTFSTIATDVAGANGVALDAERRLAYVVGVGADFSGGNVFRISLDGSKPTEMWQSPHGILDGVAFLQSGDLLVSDWGTTGNPAEGTITAYTIEGKRVRQIDAGMVLHGPADFTYDAETGKLWVPLMIDGRVIAIDLPH